MSQVIKEYVGRIRAGLLALSLGASLVMPVVAGPSAFALSGAGTSLNPYLVNNCTEFEEVSNDNAAHYLLTQDIDCSSDGSGVMDPSAFTGTFDGGGHTITVNIDSSDSFVGLFSQLDGATVSHLTVAGSVQSNNNGGADVGALTGQMSSTTVNNVTINAAVTLLYNSSGYTGGLAGFMLGSTITNTAVTNDVISYDSIAGGFFGSVACGVSISDSYFSGNVSANGNYAGGISGTDGCQGPTTTYTRVHSTGTIVADGSQVGGLVGAGSWVIINDSYANGYVDGIDQVGGLVGSASANSSISRSYASAAVNAYGNIAGGMVGSLEYGGLIDQSYATGEVSAGGYAAGGLVGYFDGVNGSPATISNSYARGAVAGDQAGGLIGSFDSGNVTTSYATGSIDSSHTSHGGLVGADIGEPTDSLFWDTQSSGVASSTVGTGKTTAQMKLTITYTAAATPGIGTIWDFVNNPHDDTGTNDIWNIVPAVNDGYPCLMWVSGCAPVVTPAPSADNDGISTPIEDAAPNNGDANNDGQPDSAQANVASFVNLITNSYSVLAAPSACAIASVSNAAEVINTNQDSGFSYPVGLMNFTLNCGTPGYTAVINLYYYSATQSAFVARKYNPLTHAYYAVPEAMITTTTIGSQAVTHVSYQITDGGPLDTDTAVNGVIADPVGLALSAIGVPDTGLGGTAQL